MKTRWSLFASVLLAAGCATAADDLGWLEGAMTCEPGTAYDCACSTGSAGTQLCDETGDALLPCDCGGSAASPPTGTGGASAEPGTDETPVSGTGGAAPLGTGGAPLETGTGGGWEAPDPGSSDPPQTGTETPPASPGTGTCCPSGDCLCHGPGPTGLTSADGPFNTATFNGSTGTVHYPTNAEPPFAAVAVCGGFLNTGPEMAAWGTFYASHGIVTIITSTLGSDFPEVRATKLLASIEELKGQNTNASSPLFGKLAGRYGTSGYSMGGGGTTIASRTDATLRTSVGLASWNPTGTNVTVPTLLLCGSSDTTAPCSMSQSAYGAIPSSTPKMMVSIAGVGHLSWFGPTSAGGGVSGETALAFQKVFLEGDERWRPYLLQSRGTVTKNVQ
jgi:pimeloyl-ACP methyl ester carboxylesterase